MLANSGRVCLEEVLKSLIDTSNPARRFYKVILAEAKVDYILPILHKVFRGEIPTFNKSEDLKNL